MNSSSKAKQKYNAKSYDRIQLMVPKGNGEYWKAEAIARGLSMNAFVQTAVRYYLENAQPNNSVQSVCVENMQDNEG